MRILDLKGYKWLLSQNQRVRINFLGYVRYEEMARHIKAQLFFRIDISQCNQIEN